MSFVIGFVVWTVFGLAAAAIVRTAYPAVGTMGVLTFIFGIGGAFVGGMLGLSAYVFRDPLPLQLGGLLGAAIGAVFATFLYHFMARNYV